MPNDRENCKLNIILQGNMVSFESITIETTGVKFFWSKVHRILSELFKQKIILLTSWPFPVPLGSHALFHFISLMLLSFVCISHLVHSFWFASYVFSRTLFLYTKFSSKISFKTHSFWAYAKILSWLDWEKEPLVCKPEIAWRTMVPLSNSCPTEKNTQT